MSSDLFNPSVGPRFLDDEDDNEPASKGRRLAGGDRGQLMKSLANLTAKVEQREARPDTVQEEQRQLDLFVADILDYSFKDDMASMEAPLFSLATKPDMKTWRWESPDGKKWLEVTPSAKGRATMHDKDLLIYLTSQLVAAMNEAARCGTKMPGRRVQFVLHDYFISTKKGTSDKTYAAFEDTLDRLQGTRLKTNIARGNDDHRKSFGLLDEADYIMRTDRNGKQRMCAIEVTISKWLYRAMEQKQVLTISDKYFSLRKPLEKRIYELARKHVGSQAEWFISEDALWSKTGSQASIYEFRRMLKDIIERDTLLDYRIQRDETGRSGVMIRMYQKDVKKFAAAYGKQNAGDAKTQKIANDIAAVGRSIRNRPKREPKQKTLKVD